jgi:short subunit dehydrogenase-like uncharacterized protein
MKYMIYGAYGYTGRLIVEAALKKGHSPTLAGRDEAKVKALASEFNLEGVSFDLSDPLTVDQHIGA